MGMAAANTSWLVLQQHLSLVIEVVTGGKSLRGWSLSHLIEIAMRGESRYGEAPGG